MLTQGHHAFKPQPPRSSTTDEATATMLATDSRHRSLAVSHRLGAYSAADSIISFSPRSSIWPTYSTDNLSVSADQNLSPHRSELLKYYVQPNSVLAHNNIYTSRLQTTHHFFARGPSAASLKIRGGPAPPQMPGLGSRYVYTRRMASQAWARGMSTHSARQKRSS